MSYYWLPPWHCLFTSTRLIQCSGSGSVIYLYGSGSWSGTGSFHQQEKIWRKTSPSSVVWPFYDYLSVKNDVNIPSKRNKHKNLEEKKVFVSIWKSLTKEQDPEPDSSVKGTDPRIRICTKISRTWNLYTFAGSKGVKRLFELNPCENKTSSGPKFHQLTKGKSPISYRHERLVDAIESFVVRKMIFFYTSPREYNKVSWTKCLT